MDRQAWKKVWEKMKMNSFYPATGADRFAMYDPERAAQITKTGRKTNEFLDKIREKITPAQRLMVEHEADLMIKLGEILDSLQDIVDEINETPSDSFVDIAFIKETIEEILNKHRDE